ALAPDRPEATPVPRPARATVAPVPAPVRATPRSAPPPAPAPVRATPRSAPPPAPAPVRAAPRSAPPPALAPVRATTPRPAPSPDQKFLDLASGIPGVTVVDPARAAATGRALCTDLRHGETPAEAAALTARDNEGVTPSQARAAVGAAITAYCPQYPGR
ncbi:MAG: DUF732 domain-containing protein, partial [Mycobacterium sp.]|nr:DUF732 domain-containing protein [Mycobacterium sp.]